MQTQILDGKAIAGDIRQQLKTQVQQRAQQGLAPVGLAVVLVGENPASQVYVRNKRKSCDEVGITSFSHDLPLDTTQADLLTLIDELNANPKVHGILVQLPLPEHINDETVIERINPLKDVDGFHPYNIGRLALKMPALRPCTPKGVMTLLSRTGQQLSGLDAVIIGQSNIVGRPMALELLAARCTITVCHSRTRGLAEKIRQADVVVAAVGRANFVQGDWIKQGALVIDVGINRGDDGKLVGDVDFDAVQGRAGWITPVPGGVGPMTIASLLENTLQAAQMQDQLNHFG